MILELLTLLWTRKFWNRVQRNSGRGSRLVLSPRKGSLLGRNWRAQRSALVDTGPGPSICRLVSAAFCRWSSVMLPLGASGRRRTDLCYLSWPPFWFLYSGAGSHLQSVSHSSPPIGSGPIQVRDLRPKWSSRPGQEAHWLKPLNRRREGLCLICGSLYWSHLFAATSSMAILARIFLVRAHLDRNVPQSISLAIPRRLWECWIQKLLPGSGAQTCFAQFVFRAASHLDHSASTHHLHHLVMCQSDWHLFLRLLPRQCVLQNLCRRTWGQPPSWPVEIPGAPACAWALRSVGSCDAVPPWTFWLCNPCSPAYWPDTQPVTQSNCETASVSRSFARSSHTSNNYGSPSNRSIHAW